MKIKDNFIDCGTQSIDSRGRVAVGKALIKFPKAKRFFLYVGDKGDILLRPAAEIPLKDLR